VNLLKKKSQSGNGFLSQREINGSEGSFSLIKQGKKMILKSQDWGGVLQRVARDRIGKEQSLGVPKLKRVEGL